MRELDQLKILSESIVRIEESDVDLDQFELAQRFEQLRKGSGRDFIELLDYVTLKPEDMAASGYFDDEDEGPDPESTAILAVDEFQEQQFGKMIYNIFGMYETDGKFYFNLSKMSESTQGVSEDQHTDAEYEAVVDSSPDGTDVTVTIVQGRNPVAQMDLSAWQTLVSDVEGTLKVGTISRVKEGFDSTRSVAIELKQMYDNNEKNVQQIAAKSPEFYNAIMDTLYPNARELNLSGDGDYYRIIDELTSLFTSNDSHL